MMTTPQIRRAYVDTDLGQMHCRTAGEGAPVVMLHWGPSSSRMFEPHLPMFAAKGYRAIAVDIIGYGQSDKLERAVSSVEHASAISQAMDALKVGGGYFIGGHMPSTIAVEVALQRNDIRKLVLDGTPLLEADETARMMAGVYPGPWSYQDDGAHETSFWKSTIAVMKLWDPAFKLTPANLPSIYAFMVDHIESGTPGIARIAPTHDMRERLPLLSLPVLVLTSENEPLRPAFERTLDLLQNGRGHIFPGSHPLHHAERAAEYVDVIAKFFAE